MKRYKCFLQKWMKAELFIGGIIILVLVSLMCMEIVMRYFLNSPIVWVQEFVIFLFILITAIGASVAVKTQSHIAIDTVLLLFPKKAVEVINVIASVGMLASLVVLMVYLPKTMSIQNMSTTSSLPLNFPRGYYYSLPVLLSVIGMFIGQLYHLYYEVQIVLGHEVVDDIEIKHIDHVRGIDVEMEEI